MFGTSDHFWFCAATAGGGAASPDFHFDFFFASRALSRSNHALALLSALRNSWICARILSCTRSCSAAARSFSRRLPGDAPPSPAAQPPYAPAAAPPHPPSACFCCSCTARVEYLAAAKVWWPATSRASSAGRGLSAGVVPLVHVPLPLLALVLRAARSSSAGRRPVTKNKSSESCSSACACPPSLFDSPLRNRRARPRSAHPTSTCSRPYRAQSTRRLSALASSKPPIEVEN